MAAALSLTEIARLLGEPQHRLIYLCEKGVVVPEVGKSSGRGSSRLFSEWNLLEFAVALRLRELSLQARVIGGLLAVLRAFMNQRAPELSGKEPLAALRARGGPSLRMWVEDGKELQILWAVRGGADRRYGGVVWSDLDCGEPRGGWPGKIEEVAREGGKGRSSRGPGRGGTGVELRVDITRIARGLPSRPPAD